MNDDFTLGRRAVAQVIELIRRVGAELVNPDAGHRGAPPALLSEVKFLAQTTTTITARSGDTPGEGTVQIYRFDDENDLIVKAQANGEDWTVDVKNWVASEIASGTPVTVFEDPWGTTWIDAEECP